RLALRHALDDVEQRDIAERLERAQVREGAADHAGADEGDLLACHGGGLLRRRHRGIGSRGRGLVKQENARPCKPARESSFSARAKPPETGAAFRGRVLRTTSARCSARVWPGSRHVCRGACRGTLPTNTWAWSTKVSSERMTASSCSRASSSSASPRTLSTPPASGEPTACWSA